jgi:thymidylate synthase
MAEQYFSASTLDDVMRGAIEAIQLHGDQIHPGKGPAVELAGVLLEVTDPRARLSRTEARGKPFSCLGELCWYLAGSNDLEFIAYYLPKYKDCADGEIIFGGYGPRLFNWKGLDQLANVTALLRERPDSRRAVLQLFDAADIVEEHKDVPCTCTLQFMLRSAKLHMFSNMRSNDVFVGLPHDIFSFTMLQEIMARVLSVEVGTYKHAVGSLHLYDSDRDAAQRFLDEGWQSTKMPMPSMPIGDPWPAIRLLLEAESVIRSGNPFDIHRLENIDAYWADLILMLQVFRYKKDGAGDKIRALTKRLSSPVYGSFIDKQLGELS